MTSQKRSLVPRQSSIEAAPGEEKGQIDFDFEFREEVTVFGDRIGDEGLVQRYVARFPALCDAVDRNGTPLRVHAGNSGNREIARLFGISE